MYFFTSLIYIIVSYYLAYNLRTVFDRTNRYIITNEEDEAFMFAKEVSAG